MAGYKELREEWSFTETESGATGTKGFINQTGGTANLPEIGDPFSVAYPYVIATSIGQKLFHIRADQTGCDKDGIKYVVNYSSSAGQGYTNIDPKDPDQITFTGGNEVFSIDDPREWYWQPTLGVAGAPPTPVKSRIFKITVKGTFSKVIEIDTGDDMASYFTNQIKAKLGKVNNAIYTPVSDISFKPGQVLFSTFSPAQLVRNSEGKKVWRSTVNFAYRFLSIGSEVAQQDVPYSWFYLYRNKKDSVGDLDWQPVTNQTGAGNLNTNYLYQTADFTGIIP